LLSSNCSTLFCCQQCLEAAVHCLSSGSAVDGLDKWYCPKLAWDLTGQVSAGGGREWRSADDGRGTVASRCLLICWVFEQRIKQNQRIRESAVWLPIACWQSPVMCKQGRGVFG
jgi:hypothetical protein